MEKNWLTLYGDTFLWLESNIGLVYNAENKKKHLFPLSDKIQKICDQLINIHNLYTIELTDELIKDQDVNQWINSIVNINAGYVSLNVTFDKRPVSLIPVLKVQDNKKYYEEQDALGFKGKILENLHELTFYINGSKYGNNEYFQQTIFPVKGCNRLNYDEILSFIDNSRNMFLSNINLVGNIFLYSDFETLINNISAYSIQCTIYIMIQDFFHNIQKINDVKWPINTQFNVLVDSVFDVSFLKNISIPFSITVFVFSEDDFIEFSRIFEDFPDDQNINFIPLYNKENQLFFESYIFMEKEELDKINLTKNEIFMRQAFNIEDFGKLTVMNDGNIYANVNAISLGTINDSPYSIVYKEFTSGKSWFKLRDQYPCNNCIYQWLCPPSSNYEIVFDRPNLCHIKKC